MATTSSSQTTIDSISHRFAVDALLNWDEDPTIDVSASVDRYSDMVVEALKSAYPGADITVSWETELDAVLNPTYATITTEDGQLEVGGDDEIVIYEINPAIDGVYNTFEWVVYK